MPTYVYKCRKCGHKFEKKQKITADPLKECPKCSGKIRRIIFGSGVVFKSDGFYTTDYKRKDKEKSEKE